jgi:hypothetical protein
MTTKSIEHFFKGITSGFLGGNLGLLARGKAWEKLPISLSIRHWYMYRLAKPTQLARRNVFAHELIEE